ncbi:MAG: phosphate ABC transporter permease PstA [Anaerolineaceae bacterium]
MNETAVITLTQWNETHQQTLYQRRKWTNRIMLGITGLLTLLALVPLFWIIGYVFYKGAPSLNLEFFSQLPRPIGMAGGGVLHAIEGTLLLTLLSGIFAIPPGIIVAFYTAYHPNTVLGTVVRFATDVLSGIPSIVIGIFCYALIVKPQGHYSALAGGVALALVMLPTIIRTTEEMIKLVPGNLREASLGLGGSEWKTALRVTLPAARNGIITGCLLALARASGETAPLLFTALGNDRFEIGRMFTLGAQTNQSVFSIIGGILNQPVDSLPLTLYKYTQQPFPERVAQAWGVALILMMIVLATNILTRVVVSARNKNR